MIDVNHKVVKIDCKLNLARVTKAVISTWLRINIEFGNGLEIGLRRKK